MAGKRNWKEYPRNLGKKLIGPVGSFVVVGGAFIGIASLVTIVPFSAAIGEIGAVLTVIGLGLTAWKAVPLKTREAGDLLGQRLTLSELKAISPPLVKLGIMGRSKVGKTTLVSNILQKAPPGERTRGVHAYIAALQTSPIHYVALVDGGGQLYADQFEVAAKADIVCILVDHNISDIDPNPVETRLKEHSDFVEQYLGYLVKHREEHPLVWIHLLLNKRDLWEKATLKDKQQMQEFLANLVNKWQTSNLAKYVTANFHSNWHHPDSTAYIAHLVNYITQGQP